MILHLTPLTPEQLASGYWAGRPVDVDFREHPATAEADVCEHRDPTAEWARLAARRSRGHDAPPPLALAG